MAPRRAWAGAVLCRDVLDGNGHPVLTKGTVFGPEHEDVLRTARPGASCTCSARRRAMSVRTLRPMRIAAAVGRARARQSGRPSSHRCGWWRHGAAWSPSTSMRLAAVNAVDGRDGLHGARRPPCGCGTNVGRRQDHALAIDKDALEAAVRAAGSARAGAGIVSVRPFLPLRVAAIVRQHLTDDARMRFERSLAMRSTWFGRRHRTGPVCRR